MKNIFLLIISLFITLTITSCKNENSLILNIDKPDDLLSEDSLINVLVDIHMADAIISQSTFVNEEKKTFTYSAYGNIFKKHNISKTRFETSLGYYSASPDELHKIYEKVLAKMSELEGNSIAKEVKAEKKK